MADFFADNADLQFYMNHWIDWASLVDLTEYLGRAPDAYASTAEAVAS